MEKISVIIPVYGVEKYIRECLDSIISQTYTNMEIIIIDDGSKDRCGDICNEYAESDNRIRVIHKKNEGLCAARNDGIKASTGSWILFIDADDWCDTDYVEKLADSVTNTEADILVCGGHYIEDEKNKPKIEKTFSKDNIFEGDALIICMAKILAPFYKKDVECPSSLGAPWDKLYRRDFLIRNSLRFDTSSRAWEDLWFNMNAFYSAQKIQVDSATIGYHYRMVRNSITKKYNENKPEINYDFIDKIHRFINDNKLCDTILTNAIHARSISLFSSALRSYYLNDECQLGGKDITDGIKKMKQELYYKNAIKDKSTLCYSKRQVVLKLIMCQPFITPLKMAIRIG